VLYSDEELEILEAVEKNDIEKVNFDNNDIKEMAKQTLAYNQEKKQISIKGVAT
jgi:hypothetical protein